MSDMGITTPPKEPGKIRGDYDGDRGDVVCGEESDLIAETNTYLMSTQRNPGIILAEQFLRNKPSMEVIKAEIAALHLMSKTYKETEAGRMYQDAADCLTAFTSYFSNND